MVLFGFDTYDAKCVHSASAAERYEDAAEWERDRSSERRARERKERRHRKKTGRRLSASSHGYLRCYKKKTGHVDGALE